MGAGKLFSRMKEPEFIEAFLRHRMMHPSPHMDVVYAEDYCRSEEYLADIDRLASGDYFFDVPVRKTIPKSLSDKKRTVFCFGGRQKVLLQAMSYALHDYDKRFPNCVYSAKLGKSFKEYTIRLKNDPSFGEMYAVKVDISSYGSSIDTDILVQKLERFLEEDPELFDFFRWLLQRREYLVDGEVMRGDMSALPGIPIHNFFTNLYLLDMDRRLQAICTGYCRYSDDILAFVDDSRTAQELMAIMKEEIIEKGKLSLNEKKTAIHEPHSRIEHMGISYQDGRIDLSDYALYKLKRKMRIRTKRIRRQMQQGKLTAEEGAKLLIRLNNQTFFGRGNSKELCWSRWLFPMLTEHAGLQKLDLYFQRCLRYILTGKWSDSGYRIKYGELKAIGYRSLVREYYRDKRSKKK